MKRRAFLLSALALGLAAAGCAGGDKEPPLDENLIRTVERGDLVDEVSESGKITPRFDVDIKSKVSGEVQEVLVEEGQSVKKGDLLYRIVDTEYARDVALARVGLKQAQLERENAEVDRQRKEMALNTRGISASEYDVARRQVELAAINIESLRVQLQGAADQLAYTKIYAPIDGVVIVRNVEPGEVVTAGVTATVNGEAQLTIAQMDKLLLEIDLNQVDVAKVQTGQEARILLDAYPGVEVPGIVSQIAAAGHTDTTRNIDVFTVKVEVDPSKSTVAIKPGMTAEVRIRIGTWPNVVKLPAETVFEEEGKSQVFLVTEVDGKKTKEKHEIQVGHRSDREVEVTSGLEVGQQYYAQPDIKDMSASIDLCARTAPARRRRDPRDRAARPAYAAWQRVPHAADDVVGHHRRVLDRRDALARGVRPEDARAGHRARRRRTHGVVDPVRG
jgi:RND family efflux transporter MFP subunit